LGVILDENGMNIMLGLMIWDCYIGPSLSEKCQGDFV